MRGKAWKGTLFVLPSLLGVLIFYILPFLSSITYCFTTGVGKKEFVGLQNFIELFENELYQLAIKNTIIIFGIALPILVGISIVITLVIENNLKKFKWLQLILLIPMVMPSASMTLLWQDLFGKEGLDNIGGPLIVVILILWKNIGYNIILLMSTLMSLPKEYEEAASLDGAGFWCIARKIKIPYMLPVVFFCIVISLLNCFKIFREVYLLQGDYPGEHIYMLQHFMNINFINLNYEVLAASAFLLYMVIFVIIYIVSRLQQSYSKEI